MPLSRLQSRALAAGRSRAARHDVSGDEDAAGGPPDLESIYRLHADTVATWARRMGGPDLDIEDIVHEVFLIAQRRLPEWRGDAKITTWLHEITLRVVQNRRRRLRWWRWRTGSRDGGRRPAWSYDDELSRIPADQPGALEMLEKREATSTLYHLLDGIGEKYRTVLVLFELEGLSGEQIAALTGTSPANVWTRLHRGRQKIMKRFLAWEAMQKP